MSGDLEFEELVQAINGRGHGDAAAETTSFEIEEDDGSVPEELALLRNFHVPAEEEWLLHVAGDGRPPEQQAKAADFGRFSQAPASAVEEETALEYALSIARHLLRPSASLRGKQAKLTLWELLEIFDCINDLYFIGRVGRIMRASAYSSDVHMQRVAGISVLMLSVVWFVSVGSYATRRYTIYHRIEPSSRLFVPGASILEIRRLGTTMPEALYMFERLAWTYQVTSRCLEDIPQLLISAYFMANFGQSFYTYFMIVYSMSLTVATSVRMGATFPLLATLSTAVSRRPEVDSANVEEAAPPTSHFALLLAGNFGLWGLGNLLCLRIVRGAAFAIFTCAGLCSWGISALMVAYWVHLTSGRGCGGVD